MNSKFKIKQSKIVFSNQYFVFKNDALLFENNLSLDYFYFLRPKGVAIVVHEDDRVLLLKEYRYPIKAYSYNIPIGGINEGETPLEAAKRELIEETGLLASTWTLESKFHLANGYSDSEIILFFATGITKSKREEITGEDITTDWIDLRQLATKLFIEKKIKCSPSFSSLSMFLFKNNYYDKFRNY